jgi:hypothetical protein
MVVSFIFYLYPLNIMLKNLFKGGEQFWFTYPLKGSRYEFLFLGQPRDFAKLQSMNLQEVRDECTMEKWYTMK